MRWKARVRAKLTVETINWERHDVIACPTFAVVTHRNRSALDPAILLQVDDAPLQHKLGFYEDEIVRKAVTRS